MVLKKPEQIIFGNLENWCASISTSY